MSGKNKKKKSGGIGYTLSQEDICAIQTHFNFFNSEGYRRITEGNDKFTISRECVRKREKAVKALLPVLYKQYSLTYRRTEIRDMLLYSTVIPVDTLGKIEETNYLIIGAAIWLLDYFKENDLISELKKLLPENPVDRDDYELPYFTDTVHSSRLVDGIIEVLMERDSRHHSLFCDILKLVDKPTVNEMKQLFEKNINAFFSLALAYQRWLSDNYPQDSSDKSDVDMFGMTNIHDLINEVEAQQSDEGQHIFRDFLIQAPSLMNLTYDAKRKHLNDRYAADILHSFGEGDPYELCAAHLFCSVKDDAMLHLNTATAVTLGYVLARLPWTQQDVFIEESIVERGEPDIYSLDYEINDFISDEEEETEGDADDEYKYAMNAAQIIYETNNVLLPRKLRVSEELVDWICTQNVPKEKAHELAMVAYALWYVDKDDYCNNLPPDEATEDIPSDESEPVEAVPDDNTVTDKNITEYNTALKKQLKEAQEALAVSERSNQSLRKKLQQIADKHKSDTDELHNLRETLFRIKSEDEYEDIPQELKIEFPYYTKRRICIFGGHDTWRKQIKPLLPDANFYDRETFPHPDSIKNADIVWIQANSMSHSYFYRVIDVAREHKIPYRYFGFASVRKCAEQVVMEEITAEK